VPILSESARVDSFGAGIRRKHVAADRAVFKSTRRDSVERKCTRSGAPIQAKTGTNDSEKEK